MMGPEPSNYGSPVSVVQEAEWILGSADRTAVDRLTGFLTHGDPGRRTLGDLLRFAGRYRDPGVGQRCSLLFLV